MVWGPILIKPEFYQFFFFNQFFLSVFYQFLPFTVANLRFQPNTKLPEFYQVLFSQVEFLTVMLILRIQILNSLFLWITFTQVCCIM